MRTIIVPLDGSPLAECALASACRVARQTGAQLVLLCAVPHAPNPQAPTSPLRVTSREAYAYLKPLAGRLGAEGIDALVEVLHTDPARAIRFTARRRCADLIVMSTHGHTGLRKVLLGSVAAQVLEQAQAPVMIVRARDQVASLDAAPFRKILVPVDGSSLGDAALSYVASGRLAEDGEITLVHAVGSSLPTFVPGVVEPIARHIVYEAVAANEQRIAAMRYSLDALAQRYLQGHMYSLEVRTGHPGTAILAAAEAAQIDLIVMATHARTGWDRMVHGSITEHVLHHARIPVLVIHNDAASLIAQPTAPVASGKR